MNDFQGMLEQFAINMYCALSPEEAEKVTIKQIQEFVKEWSEKNTTQL